MMATIKDVKAILRLLSSLVFSIYFVLSADSHSSSSLDSMCLLSQSLSNANESGFYRYPLEYYSVAQNAVTSISSSSVQFSVPCKAKFYTRQEYMAHKDNEGVLLDLNCTNYVIQFTIGAGT